MPLYEYKCVDCKTIIEEFRHIKDFENPGVCVNCGGVCNKIFSLVNTDCKTKKRVLRSIGVHPDLVRSGEAHKMHPGAEFDHQGNIIAYSRKEKLQRIKEHNVATGQNLIELD